MELTDTKGYRSRYINALNAEVRRTRIIGGDVTPEESDAGTLLRIDRTYPQSRFELFRGVAELGESGSQAGELESTLCVGDGSFFVNGELVKLKNATNTKYLSKGVRPRSSGWISKGAPEKGSSGNSWSRCDVVILKYLGDYYLAFRYDDMELYKLISDDATEDIESAIEVFMTFGSFSYADGAIVQKINTDIFITAEYNKLSPWQIVKRDDEYYIVDCVWEFDEPDIPTGTREPTPKTIQPFDESWTATFEEDGHKYYRLTDVTDLADSAYLYAYATLTETYSVVRLVSHKLKETPACILLATFKREVIEGESVITSFTQRRTGIFHSRWEETEPYFVRNLTGSGYERLTEAPKGLEEGTTMNQYTFWRMRTEINDQLYRASEFIAFEDGVLKDEQIASPRGSFVWRYALHYSAKEKALIIDTETTPVANITADIYAQEVAQPFVEKIEVAYPESPLDQGSVDAVGGEIRVLMVGKRVDTSVRLFTTESIDTTDGSLIETT